MADQLFKPLHEQVADVTYKRIQEYLKTPEGRSQLKQMIEEAEKKDVSLSTALLRYAETYREGFSIHCITDEHWDALREAKKAVRAAAQREYGKTVGVKDESITASINNDRVYVWKSGWLHLDCRAEDLPGILYALSTLEEK